MAMPLRITDWTAKRAGGAITISGTLTKSVGGKPVREPVKITGVDRIAIAGREGRIYVYKGGTGKPAFELSAKVVDCAL